MDSTDEAELQRTEDELTTLKEIVQEALENQGVLGNIRAQLRAAVFSTIEDEESKSKMFSNQNIMRFAKSDKLRLSAALFLDFLDTLSLDSTKAVFEPEVLVGNDISRKEIAEKVGISTYSEDVPLIFNLLGDIISTKKKGGQAKEADKLKVDSPSTSNVSSPNTKIKQLDNELQKLVENDKSGKVKDLANLVGGPGGKMDNNSIKSEDSNNDSKEDEYTDDGFEVAEEIEDDLSLEQVEEESLDIDQSTSLGESSGFLSMSGGGGSRSAYDKEELSMSTSIVQDSMELSVQNSRALDEYDFVEVVQKPNEEK